MEAEDVHIHEILDNYRQKLRGGYHFKENGIIKEKIFPRWCFSR